MKEQKKIKRVSVAKALKNGVHSKKSNFNSHTLTDKKHFTKLGILKARKDFLD
jgi:hypothetical protein